MGPGGKNFSGQPLPIPVTGCYTFIYRNNPIPTKGPAIHMIHFLTYPTASTFICGADAVGRRNTRVQTNSENTTCARCLEQLHLDDVEVEMERSAGI